MAKAGALMATRQIRELLRAPVSEFALANVDPSAHPGAKDKATARKQVDAQAEQLFALQERLYAEQSRALLVVLQGMDTCGKDGAIKKVVGNLNPAGVRVTSFKAPTDEEKRHGFLWRIRRTLPVPGNIAVFNRSHYEDVGIVKVHGWAEPAVIERRYGEITRFENQVAQSGVRVVKCFLHISYDEQRQRLLARLDDPTKHWKFKVGDLDERARWDDYMTAYETAIARCNTDAAPWYVIPANHKWYRDWALSHLLVETLTDMDPRYPRVDLDIPALKRRLKPPG
jgi:PPK2 family polyphosphate:nucleotide phosphotransferase